MTSPSSAKASRPNILLLMTDQQRFDTIAAAGHPHMITPNLDRLVREGCLFRNAYTPNPICVPARHHTLTGSTGRYHGYYLNDARPMPISLPTLPGLLSDAGYETRAIGKMHFYPARRHHGFDRMELMEETPAYREHDEYAMYLKTHGQDHVQNLHGLRNLLYEAPQRSLVPDEHHGSTWVADRTIAFLNANRGRQPFFCWSSWIAPHPPYNLPHSMVDAYRDADLPKPIVSRTTRNPFTLIMTDEHTYPHPDVRDAFFRRRQEVYYAQITYVDQQIGRIYDTLKHTGLLDNTLILFTSDHGEMLSDHGSHQKAQSYESSSRIPLIARYPKAFAAGSTTDDFADLNDILPTALDLAGVTHPQPEVVAGRSLLQPGQAPRDQYLSLGERGRRWATVRDARYKYTWYYGFDHQDLFDLQADPGETINLLDDPTSASAEILAVRDRLHARVVEMEKRWGPPGHVDEQGQLKRFDPPAEDSLRKLYEMRGRQSPRFPSRIMDSAEKAKITTFGDEAFAAVRDEPVSRLDHLDLSMWKPHGLPADFDEKVTALTRHQQSQM